MEVEAVDEGVIKKLLFKEGESIYKQLITPILAILSEIQIMKIMKHLIKTSMKIENKIIRKKNEKDRNIEINENEKI